MYDLGDQGEYDDLFDPEIYNFDEELERRRKEEEPEDWPTDCECDMCMPKVDPEEESARAETIWILQWIFLIALSVLLGGYASTFAEGLLSKLFLGYCGSAAGFFSCLLFYIWYDR